MFQTNPETASATETLKAFLLELPIGQSASYKQLSEAAGMDITEARWVLIKARQSAEEESGGIFETVRGYGVQRLTSDRVPDVGLSCVQKVRRAAKRGVSRLSCVRVNDMSETDKHRLLAHKSQLGAIALVADGRKTISIAASSGGAELPPKDAILALIGGMKG